MTDNHKLRAYILLDRSGSMASRWDEALSSINTYVQGLKQAGGHVTLATFDRHEELQFDVVRDDNVNEWRPLQTTEMQPRGDTPLFDAIGRMTAKMRERGGERAVFVVMTDGHENASKERNRDWVRNELDALRNRGWQVVFLGADFDAFGQAHDVGVLHGNTLNMQRGFYASGMSNLATATASYAATGQTMSFTDEDRRAASGKTNP